MKIKYINNKGPFLCRGILKWKIKLPFLRTGDLLPDKDMEGLHKHTKVCYTEYLEGIAMKYTLMNKNVSLIDFHWEEFLGVESTAVIDKEYQRIWFLKDLNTWLQYRSVTKHRLHMDKLLRAIGLTGTKAIIDFSKGLSLTDTLWVNIDDRFQWEQVNLFDNEFDEVIEKIAFDGGMYGKHFSTTSPEFGTNGMFAKCWHRETDGQIYLYKQGSQRFANAGWEVYSELYASQILDRLGYAHAKYDLIKYRGRLVSRCPLFTSPKKMLLPFTAILESESATFRAVLETCQKYGIVKEFTEHLITDALIVNEDRHLGNLGVICDADTFEVKGMAPIYDNGSSLCCYYRPELESESLVQYSQAIHPVLYSDFVEGVRATITREQLEQLGCLNNFRFDTSGQYNLPEERLKSLEELVQVQLRKLQSIKPHQSHKAAEATSAFRNLEN